MGKKLGIHAYGNVGRNVARLPRGLVWNSMLMTLSARKM